MRAWASQPQGYHTECLTPRHPSSAANGYRLRSGATLYTGREDVQASWTENTNLKLPCEAVPSPSVKRNLRPRWVIETNGNRPYAIDSHEQHLYMTTASALQSHTAKSPQPAEPPTRHQQSLRLQSAATGIADIFGTQVVTRLPPRQLTPRIQPPQQFRRAPQLRVSREGRVVVASRTAANPEAAAITTTSAATVTDKSFDAATLSEVKLTGAPTKERRRPVRAHDPCPSGPTLNTPAKGTGSGHRPPPAPSEHHRPPPSIPLSSAPLSSRPLSLHRHASVPVEDTHRSEVDSAAEERQRAHERTLKRATAAEYGRFASDAHRAPPSALPACKCDSTARSFQVKHAAIMAVLQAGGVLPSARSHRIAATNWSDAGPGGGPRHGNSQGAGRMAGRQKVAELERRLAAERRQTNQLRAQVLSEARHVAWMPHDNQSYWPSSFSRGETVSATKVAYNGTR